MSIALNNNGVSYIRNLWIGSFTGMAGMSLHWNAGYDYALWQSHFPQIAAFLAPYNFNESSGNVKGWMPGHDYDEMHYENWQRKPGIVDLFYLRSPDKQRAIGVLANRTYNFYTQWDVAKCGAFVWSGDDNGGLPIPDDQERFELTWEDDESWNDSAYNNPKTAYHINEAVGVEVKKMKKYTISYIDPYTLQVLGTQNKYNGSGKLNLDFPYLTGSQTRPILLVKIEPKKDKSPEEYPDSVHKYLDQIAYEMQEKLSSIAENSNARIYPNPADDFVMIELPTNITSCKIDLLSCSGTIIKSENFTGSMFKFYFGEISTGIYILRLYYNQKVETYKLSVQ